VIFIKPYQKPLLLRPDRSRNHFWCDYPVFKERRALYP